MSIVTVDRTRNIFPVAKYVVVGDRPDGQQRAAALAMASSTNTDDWARWAEHAQRASLENKGRNVNTGITLVQSWSPDELDKDNARDVQHALFAATELAQRLAPNSPYLVGIHTDGRGGAVHAHIILANHDYQTDRPLDQQASNWHHVRKVNDQVMRDLKMQVLERHPISLMSHERLAQRERREIRAYDDDGQLTAVGPDTWADHLRAGAERAQADARAVDLDALSAVAPEYGVEMRIKGIGEKAAISWGLLDERGETQRVTIKARKGKEKSIACAAPGKRLGTDYGLEAVQAQLAQRAQEQQLRAAAQAVREEMQNFGIEFEEEEYTAHGTTTTPPAGATDTVGGDTGTGESAEGVAGSPAEGHAAPTGSAGDPAGLGSRHTTDGTAEPVTASAGNPDTVEPGCIIDLANASTGDARGHAAGDRAGDGSYCENTDERRPGGAAEPSQPATGGPGAEPPGPVGAVTRPGADQRGGATGAGPGITQPADPERGSDHQQPSAGGGHQADDRRGQAAGAAQRRSDRREHEAATRRRTLAEIRRQAQASRKPRTSEEPEFDF